MILSGPICSIIVTCSVIQYLSPSISAGLRRRSMTSPTVLAILWGEWGTLAGSRNICIHRRTNTNKHCRLTAESIGGLCVGNWRAGPHRGQLHLPHHSHPSEIGKWSASLLAGVKVGRVHLCRVAGNTVYDPVWQVTPHSSRTSSCRGFYSALILAELQMICFYTFSRVNLISGTQP